MNYGERLSLELRPAEPQAPRVLDLFAGCGGLALGFESSGFETLGFEMDADCCATYSKNLLGECINIKLGPEFKFPSADVVIGGPPCQPFSVGGMQKGVMDSRDGFPAFISAVEQANPKIWLFENVKGLLYRNRGYLDKIIRHMQGLGYLIEFRVLNAVDFGVPQNRERVIVVGHRGQFGFPESAGPKVSAGEALEGLPEPVRGEEKFLTPSMDRYVLKYELASKCINPRDLHLHKPARTLTCRNLAGATGDMQRIRLPDGRRRRLTPREAARLQSFPDWFEFSGAETSVFNQIGNAVPPLMGRAIARSVRSYLEIDQHFSAQDVIRGKANTTLMLEA